MSDLADSEHMCNIALALMSENAGRWVDRMTARNAEPSTFPDFETAFL